MRLNNFKDDLRFSLDASQESFWDNVYKKAFVDLKYTKICTNIEHQKMGIDRFIYLKSSRIFAVDEKVRRAVYADIALEFISNDRTGAPGWIEKQMAIDYLAYAFMPIKRVYLFQWPMLRRAWEHYKTNWKSIYPTIKAVNQNYNTLSVAVPISELRKRVHMAEVIQL